MNEPSAYWFPAKRYGWGWGLPTRWQGWLALLVFAGAQLLGPFLFDPHRQTLLYSAYAGIFTAAFLAICYLKGEPPSWRWGPK